MKLGALLAVVGVVSAQQMVVKSVTLPDVEPRVMRAYASLDTLANKESSGIVKSRTQQNLFWVHNDSGDKTCVYPVRVDGTMYSSHRLGAKTGCLVGDAVSFDWEDITCDTAGNLIIGDFGNNCQCRRDMLFYIINEPHSSQEFTTVKQKIFFRFPDQPIIPAPPEDINYDVEATFFANGKIHLLSKNRTNTYTRLYRLDKTEPFVTNELTLIDAFDVGGQVTGADASEDGKTLAVLTYTSVWLFSAQQAGRYFDGDIAWLPIKAEQAEAICFDGADTLIVTDEIGGRMYRIGTDELYTIRK
jgi:hypothetical protein